MTAMDAGRAAQNRNAAISEKIPTCFSSNTENRPQVASERLTQRGKGGPFEERADLHHFGSQFVSSTSTAGDVKTVIPGVGGMNTVIDGNGTHTEM